MPRLRDFSNWSWWLASAVAIGLATGMTYYFNWSDQLRNAEPTERVSPPGNKSSSGQARKLSESSDRAHPEASTTQAGETGSQVSEKRGDSPSYGIDPGKVYQALMHSDPQERDQAIKTVLLHAKALYPFNAVYGRILELCTDDDPQIAERAMHARHRLMGLRTAHEIPEPTGLDTDEAGRSGSQDILGLAVIPFGRLQELALDDPDPAVRLGAIESAVSQSDEDSFDLLWASALSDYEPDNRLSAVSELEQMLKSGLGDGEHILRLLEDTAADPDPRVAELSKLIIEERLGLEPFGASEPEPQPDEQEEGSNGDSVAESEDALETTGESFDTIQEQALYDPDPAVRLSGIEAAIGQRGEDDFGLLSEAALGDYDPDNRLSAVSALEQMLKSGLGDGEQILRLLEDTATDPDPRVAELSELIIQEQLSARAEQPQPDEIE